MKILLVLLCITLFVALVSSATPASVIIVGAGMSGISAAKQLQEAGIYDYLILEATDRIGGRIHKTQFGGHTVEKGANWLHGVGGPEKNPMFEIAKRINLKNYYSDFSNISLNTYKQEGGKYSKEEVEAALNKTESNEEFGTEFAEKLSANKDVDDDMSLLAAERLNNMEPKTALERMIDFYSFDGEQAESPRITSLKHVLPRPEYTLYGEGEYFVADERGFESIVHEYAKIALAYKNGGVIDARLYYNKVVTEIEYSDTGVTLKTEDGRVFQAKTAIISPSVGVLQSNLIKFKPELPLWKRRAIDEFSLGIYTKIFLKFPRRFWPTGPGTEFFFYVHQRRGYYAIWQQLDNEYPGSNIMFVTVADQESIRIEQQPDSKTKAEAMEVLRKIFGKNIPDATDIMIPRWNSDRFYKGTFSNWPAGYTEEKHNHLRAPIGSLYFTGEHTHAQLFGYADGAYFAGAETANDVISCLKRKVCKGNINMNITEHAFEN
ncbi:polyamine oxidase 1-like [Silene latifolia]|uniref:polyamine oxidase 1-like n=1 Tax=Silene latifolia TaxID=37657 RepID=UPI003D78991E